MLFPSHPLLVEPQRRRQLFYSSDMACHFAIWRRGWSQISLQCSPGVPGEDVPRTRRPRTVLALRELPESESISSSSTLVSFRASSEGRSKTNSSLKTGLGEHFFTWVFFLHTRFFPWNMFTLTYGSGRERQGKMKKVRSDEAVWHVIPQSDQFRHQWCTNGGCHKKTPQLSQSFRIRMEPNITAKWMS